MRDSVPITAVRVDGDIYKVATRTKALDFAVPVKYVLEDGREIATQITRNRKKDVLPAVESANQKAQEGCFAANFVDGIFIGTKTTYDLYRKATQ